MILARVEYMDAKYWALARKYGETYKAVLFSKISLRIPVRGVDKPLKLKTTLGEVEVDYHYTFADSFELLVRELEGRKEAIFEKKT